MRCQQSFEDRMKIWQFQRYVTMSLRLLFSFSFFRVLSRKILTIGKYSTLNGNNGRLGSMKLVIWDATRDDRYSRWCHCFDIEKAGSSGQSEIRGRQSAGTVWARQSVQWEVGMTIASTRCLGRAQESGTFWYQHHTHLLHALTMELGRVCMFAHQNRHLDMKRNRVC